MNIYDTAAEAGISISTVSQMLNSKGNMNPKIRDRMEAVLKKYDYKPSAMARGMVSKTMKNIAVLTVDMWVTHYARVTCVIEQEFSNLGYNVSVCNTGDSVQERDQCLEILSEKQVDGTVLIGSVFDELVEYPETTVKIRDIPVVIANEQAKLPNSCSVLIDDTKAIRMALDYMLDHGRMDLFYIFDIVTDSGRARRQGFLEAMKLRDVPNGDGRAPEGIAITDCNNSPDSRICEPELATLDNKPEFLDGICASFLRDRMGRKESVISVAIQPELMVRGSESF